jgi:hypothetical protein
LPGKQVEFSMAYEFKRPEDEEKEQGPADPQGPMAPGSPGGGTASGGGFTQPAAPAQGTGFVNFDRIMAANKDIADRNAGRLTGTLQTNAEGAKTALTGVVGNFNTAVTTGTPQDPNAPPLQPSANFDLGDGKAKPDSQPVIPPAPSTLKPASQPIQSPDELAALEAGQAGAVYGGPTDITNSDEFRDMWSKIGQSDDELAQFDKTGGLEALSQKYMSGGAGGAGGYTSGMSRMDAALLGSVGGEGFGKVAKDFGNQRKDVDSAVTLSGYKVKNAQGLADDAKKYWDQKIAEYNARPVAEEAAPDTSMEGKESFDDYMGTGGLLDGHKLEHTIQDIGKFLNPIYGIADAAGLPSLEDSGTAKYEKMLNDSRGPNSKRAPLNAQAVQLDRALPNTSEAQQRAVYDSLTRAELTALEGMTKPQQHEFLTKRLEELQAKARETLKKQGLG